jgi:ankyrin repeat protein
MGAVLNQHPDIVELLLGRGADPNLKSDEETTALMCAAGKGDLRMVDALIHHGAEINARDAEGETALSWAMEAKKGVIEEILRNHGGVK